MPPPERRIRRQNAFYHASDAEEAPWKAPGGYHPPRDDTPSTRGRPTPERPETPSPLSLHPPVSRPRTLDSRGEGSALPPPYSAIPPRHPAPQGSRPSRFLPAPPLPQARGAPPFPPPGVTITTTTLPTQPALGMEGMLCGLSYFAGTALRTPGPSIFRPPPHPPTTASITPAAALPPPKRKRKDAEDTTDGDKALDKKRPRRPPSDDVD